ncbi:MAG: helix-turn-helix domain-containing protein [Defluviitaleaceae bacterium]|nr:helix-turn-helix domain-containing protein [Defluviitaleaceae bacterium]
MIKVDNLTFGQRLIGFRTQKGLLQRELAEKTGIPSSTLSRYENGLNEPDVETIKKLAKVLEVTGNELLGISGQSSSAYAKTADEVRLLIAYRALNKDGKDHIKRTVEMTASMESYIDYQPNYDVEFSIETSPTKEEIFAEWNKGLTEEEAIDLVRQRYADAKSGKGLYSTYENTQIG